MRLDQFLVLHKNIQSRTKAQELIESGQVQVNGKTILKSSWNTSEHDQVDILDADLLKYVSRAGLKLESAFKRLNLDIKNKTVLDIGQSTGGFTDCCLQMGAGQIVGFDVGEQQLHSKLIDHPQVLSFEKSNVKTVLSNANFQKTIPPKGFDLVVCDVSFISLTYCVDLISTVLAAGGYYLLLVKPQFECGEKNLDKNGIVKNPLIYKQVQEKIIEIYQHQVGPCLDYFESGLPGRDGNKEFFIYGHKKN